MRNKDRSKKTTKFYCKIKKIFKSFESSCFDFPSKWKSQNVMLSCAHLLNKLTLSHSHSCTRTAPIHGWSKIQRPTHSFIACVSKGKWLLWTVKSKRENATNRENNVSHLRFVTRNTRIHFFCCLFSLLQIKRITNFWYFIPVQASMLV